MGDHQWSGIARIDPALLVDKGHPYVTYPCECPAEGCVLPIGHLTDHEGRALTAQGE